MMPKRLKVTLKQGEELTGKPLIAALKRLVETGSRLEREGRANGRSESDAATEAEGHRDQEG
jgi:hypothetical protein